MSPQIYVLDTNILIEAKNRYYAFDICPGFWDALIVHEANSRIESIDRIKKEITDGKYDDDLLQWVKSTLPDTFFNSTKEPDVVQKFAEMENWVQNQQQFKSEAKAEFAKGVDGWLCAYAKVRKDRIVVTHEDYAEGIKWKVKIPNICEEFHIEYKNTFDMLRELETTFII